MKQDLYACNQYVTHGLQDAACTAPYTVKVALSSGLMHCSPHGAFNLINISKLSAAEYFFRGCPRSNYVFSELAVKKLGMDGSRGPNQVITSFPPCKWRRMEVELVGDRLQLN